MAEWNPIKTAPRDGTWILLEGEFDGGDTSSTRVGCFKPSGDYEWQVFEEHHSGIVHSASDVAKPRWNWYCEGRVDGWLPLP